MDEAAYLCNRLVIMDHGKIITEGHPRDLIIEHAAENVVEVEGADQELRRFVRKSNMNYDELEERIIIYTENHEKLNKQFRERFCMDSCLYRAGNLEDVFLRLTGRELRE